VTGGPATILGGLPVWAEVWFTRGDGYSSDDDAGVSELFWLKRDGTKGGPVPDSVRDRAEAKDPYWEVDVVDKVTDYLAHEQYLEELRQRIPHLPTCSPDYPEKPRGEPAQPVVECVDGIVCCGDCGATLDTTVKLT
jgi:hypothetical protein